MKISGQTNDLLKLKMLRGNSSVEQQDTTFKSNAIKYKKTMIIDEVNLYHNNLNINNFFLGRDSRKLGTSAPQKRSTDEPDLTQKVSNGV